MAKIRIDIEALRTNKTVLESQIEELTNYNTELAALIEEIKSGWDGTPAEDYYRMMHGYYNQAVKMIEALQEFKKYAENTVNQFETLDAQSASRIRGSF